MNCHVNLYLVRDILQNRYRMSQSKKGHCSYERTKESIEKFKKSKIGRKKYINTQLNKSKYCFQEQNQTDMFYKII